MATAEKERAYHREYAKAHRAEANARKRKWRAQQRALRIATGWVPWNSPKTEEERRQRQREARQRWQARDPERHRQLRRETSAKQYQKRRAEMIADGWVPKARLSEDQLRINRRETVMKWLAANPDKVAAKRRRHWERKGRERWIAKRASSGWTPAWWSTATPEERSQRKQQASKRARAKYRLDPQNVEKQRAYSRAYAKKHRTRLQEYVKHRKATDVQFRIRCQIGSRLADAVRRAGARKHESTLKLLGCTIPELRLHLASKFTPGMSWANWGKTGWHIDHIRPLASFDLLDLEQLAHACHWTNLQPLWAADNYSKKDKYDASAQH